MPHMLIRVYDIHHSNPGLTEPVGTGPETVETGPTGSGYGRFPTGPDSKFEFEFKKWKNLTKFKYFKVCRI
jgi:hypothetical protein